MISNNYNNMRTMDNHDYAGQGNVSLAITFIFGFIAWVDTHSLSEFLKNLSVVISSIAGLMAIRYYYYATKKNKQ